jgi:azurin
MPLPSPYRSALIAALLLAASIPTPHARAETSQKIQMLSPLRFSPPPFTVEAGEKIIIDLRNDDITDQPHNFVLSTPGNVPTLVQEALTLGEKGPELGFVPENDSILVASKLIDPGNRQNLEFKAPTKPGIYPYVCTFPGHGLVMYGALYVDTPMPKKIEDDPNVPKNALADPPPPEPDRPSLQRIFMPDAGPAAIAVALPLDQNYCWDAGACRLRYAWTGGFINPIAYYRSNGNALAKILGDIYWTADIDSPAIQLGPDKTTPTFKFHGYRLIDGIPEFHYAAGNLDVRESITAHKDGLKHQFQITGASAPVHLKTGNDVTTLSPEEAKDFTYIIPTK